jgi:hypothetical protein
MGFWQVKYRKKEKDMGKRGQGDKGTGRKENLGTRRQGDYRRRR